MASAAWTASLACHGFGCSAPNSGHQPVADELRHVAAVLVDDAAHAAEVVVEHATSASGVSASPSAVKPTRSAKSTVTSRRSASLGTPRATMRSTTALRREAAEGRL